MGDDRTSAFPRKPKDTIDDDSKIQTFKQFRKVSFDALKGALTVQTEYEPDRAEFRIPQSRQLDAVLSKFRESQEDRTANWEDVLDRINRSREEYEAKASRSSTRSHARKSEGAVRVLAVITDMIPDEKGLSVLRCGLSLVFRAWANRLKNVQDILSALGDIPFDLENTYEIWKCYRDDQRLQFYVKEYFQTALSSLTQLLAILLKEDPKVHDGLNKTPHSTQERVKKVVTKVKDVGRQVFLNADTEQIQKITSELKHSKYKLDEWTGVLKQQRHTNMGHQLSEICAGMKRVETKIETGLKRDEANRAADQDRDSINECLWKELIEDAVEQGAQRGAIAAMQQIFGASRQGDRGLMNIPRFWAEPIQTGFYKLVSEDEYKRQELEWYPSQSWGPNDTTTQNPMPRGPNPVNIPYVSLSIEELLRILGANPQTSIKDEESILRQGNLMEDAAVSHTSGVMGEYAFKTWLLSSTSSSLVINGHCRDMGTRATSPVSVFCASLAVALAKAPGLIVLDYFCAKHARISSKTGDKTQGPSALIASLISQLLAYPNLPPPPLDFITPDLLTDLHTHSPRALCHVFEQLLLRMSPGKTVICIIDSVSDLEISTRGWDAEIAYIHHRLLRMVCGPPPHRLSLKLLFTTPGQSRLLGRDKTSPHINLTARRAPPDPSLWRARTTERDVDRLLRTRSGGESSRSSRLPLRSSSSGSRPGRATREGWRSGSLLEPGRM